MSGFSYGEWRWIIFAFVAIFCVIAGLAAGEGPAILLFLPVAGFILYRAYGRLKG
jgi:hypothetical protein